MGTISRIVAFATFNGAALDRVFVFVNHMLLKVLLLFVFLCFIIPLLVIRILTLLLSSVFVFTLACDGGTVSCWFGFSSYRKKNNPAQHQLVLGWVCQFR